MGYLLRRVKQQNYCNPQIWITEYKWLKPNQVPIRPLHDILTTDEANKVQEELSFWHIKKDKSNLNRIIAAIVSKWNHFDKFDYILIDNSKFQEWELKIEATKGQTADKEANDKWHFNISEFSIEKILKIIKFVSKERKFYRYTAPNVRKIFFESVTRNWFDNSEIKVENYEKYFNK